MRTLALILVLLSFLPPAGYAGGWRDDFRGWWLTPDQQGQRLFERDQFLAAAEASLLSLLHNLPMTADNWAAIVSDLSQLHGRCYLKHADAIVGAWLEYALRQEFDFEWTELSPPPPPPAD